MVPHTVTLALPLVLFRYGDMDQMYVGTAVPTEDNLDAYVENPTPVSPPKTPTETSNGLCCLCPSFLVHRT